MPIVPKAILVLALVVVACGAGPRSDADRYLALSGNEAPKRRRETVIWYRNAPALQVSYWLAETGPDPARKVEEGLRAASLAASVSSAAVQAAWRVGTASPIKRLTMAAEVIVGTNEDTSSANWSATTVTLVRLTPPVGCGSLVSIYREDHWIGWGRSFHGFPLPWKATRTATLVTSREVDLLKSVFGDRLKGPLMGGGADGPLVEPELSQSVGRLIDPPCVPEPSRPSVPIE